MTSRAVGRIKTLKPACGCKNYNSSVGCADTFPEGQGYPPLKPHFVREYTIQLASLEAINPICPAFLETAPLLPSGHFPPLGAACDVK